MTLKELKQVCHSNALINVNAYNKEGQYISFFTWGVGVVELGNIPDDNYVLDLEVESVMVVGPENMHPSISGALRASKPYLYISVKQIIDA